VGTLVHAEASPQAFDIDLFERLNQEYESHPVVPRPREHSTAARAERARRHLLKVHESIGLADLKVLELGCNTGHDLWYLSHVFGADAWGVDVTEFASWAAFADERTHFVQADLARSSPLPADSFDRVISFAVFEHVDLPLEMLRAVFRVLRPGGIAWISATLYRGPTASHRNRDVYFPWSHLLFTDDVFREFYRRKGDTPKGAAWVNKLTWEQYRTYIRRAGFRMLGLSFDRKPLDEVFFHRFETVLGRYPRADLERNLFTTVLEKPRESRPRSSDEASG
jgi:SAM-dependent methyltransferase